MRRLVDDELWELVEPLLPPEPEKPKGGRPRVPSRAALEGIVYVLRSGVPWRMLAKEELGYSGVTCFSEVRERGFSKVRLICRRRERPGVSYRPVRLRARPRG